MLEALSLPRDLENVPSNSERNAAEICQLVARLGVHAAKAYDHTLEGINTIYRLSKEKKAIKEELNEAQAEKDRLEASLQEAKEAARQKEELAAEVGRLSLAKMRLEAEKKSAEEQLPAKLQAADDAGFDRCQEAIRVQLPGLVGEARAKGERKGIQDTHRNAFLQGYQAGLDAAKIAADHSLRESVVVPEVILPDHLKSLSESEDEEEEDAEEEESEELPSSQKSAEGEEPADPSHLEKTTEELPANPSLSEKQAEGSTTAVATEEQVNQQS